MENKEIKPKSEAKFTNSSTNKQKNYLKELSQRVRPSIQEMTERLRRMPKKQWAPPSHEHLGISYVLSIDIDSKQKAKFVATTGFSDLLDFSRTSTRLSVVQSQKYRRIESLNIGLYGQNFTYIYNPDGGVLYLDHKNKTYLQLEQDQIPQIKLERDFIGGNKVDLVIQKGERLRGITTQKAIITSSYPRPFRWIIWLAPSEEFQPFFENVIEMIIGATKNRETSVQVLSKIKAIGFPLKGKIYAADSKGDFSTTPVIEFTLNEITVRKIDPGEFGIPEYYKNLRISESVRSQIKPKRYRAAKTFKLSKMREDKPVKSLKKEPVTSPVSSPSTATYTSATSASVCEIATPMCLSSTYLSQLSSRFEQSLLDDLKFILNSISIRLHGFDGNNGTIKINWLKQFQQYSDSLSQGDALYCLIRDAPVPGDPNPEEAEGGKGLLDKYAEQQAQKSLVDGSILTRLALPSTLVSIISNIVNNSATKPEDRWSSLSREQQVTIREAWLDQRIAKFDFHYTDSIGPQTIFHGLLNVEFSSIELHTRLASQIVDKLTFGNGKIELHVTIPKVYADMTLTRWPTTKYWIILAAGAIGCKLIPGACLLLGAVAAVSTFLALDIANFYVEMKNITIKVDINFIENTLHVLVPDVNASIDANVDVWYQSYIPEPLHQIISVILTLAVNWSDIILDELRDEFVHLLNEKLTDDLKLAFPPSLAPATISIVNSVSTGTDQEYIYLQSQGIPVNLLGCPSGFGPYTTQTDNISRYVLEKLITEFRSGVCSKGRQYGGFAVSQNLLNHLLYMLWCRGDFNYILGHAATEDIIGTLQELCSVCSFPEPHQVRVWPAVPPRVVFTPRNFFEKGGYATAIFDDVRLCVTASDGKYEGGSAEFLFSAKTGSQIGFGAVNPETDKLDLTRVGGRFIDVYFDLYQIGVRIIHHDIQDAVGEGPGLSPVTVSMVDGMEDVFIKAMQSMLASRNDKVVPLDSSTGYRVQRYSLAGQNVLVQLLPHRGILYGVFGLTGAILAVLPGGIINLNDHTSTNCSTGQLILNLVD